MAGNRSDHDLLICIEQKIKTLQEGQLRQDKQFENHLHHHWAVTVEALAAALVGFASLIVGLLLLWAQ